MAQKKDQQRQGGGTQGRQNPSRRPGGMEQPGTRKRDELDTEDEQ